MPTTPRSLCLPVLLLWGLVLRVLVVASQLHPQTPLTTPARPSKRVAVIGMGAGGISALKALVSLPAHVRDGWELVAFEKRDAVGGLWLPQDTPPSPPDIPDTPLYPSLRTNGPHPSMTIPHWPLSPETPLLAPHDAVLQYHQTTVSSFNLTGYIKLRHFVHEARWGRNFTQVFDHVIVASGVNRFPRWVTWDGQDQWLALGKSLTHSMYFREPDVYDGRTVMIIGGGPSGWDLVRILSRRAKKVFWSRDRRRRDNPDTQNMPNIPGAVDVARIESLAGGIVHLADGTDLPDVDALILATGYEVRMPFLTAGGHLDEVDNKHPQPADRLTTNSYYIHPLYEHTLSLDMHYPLGALYFNGIVLYNPTGMTDYAQALFTAYTIADPTLLPSREELYMALKAREARVRAEGADPAHFGHKVNKGYGPLFGHYAEGAHEDLLVHYLRDRGLAGRPGIPARGVNFTEPWRVFALEHGLDLLAAWYAGLGQKGHEWETKLTRGRRTEQDYVALMHEVVDWWRGKKEHPQ